MVNDHSIMRGLVMNGVRSPVATTPPVIVARTDKQFVPGLLKDLATSQATLSSSLAQSYDTNGVLKLYQPVHRVFQLAVLQVDCASFGAPRLDPAKIDGVGLVVRRISNTQPGVLERWSKKGSAIAGWIACADDDLDPDPARRRPQATSGSPIIDQYLPIPSSAYAPYSESVAPLYVAPPQVCKAIKATVLYGLIPVTSVEKSETIPPQGYDPDMVQQHMPYFLQLSGSAVYSQSIPMADGAFSSADADTNDALIPFLSILRQLEFELAAFNDSYPEGIALFEKLNEFTVQDNNNQDLAKLGDFLKSASQILIDKQPGTLRMPHQWPDLSKNGQSNRDNQSKTIAALFQKAMEARVAGLVSGEGRYEALNSQYRLRAFVRIKGSNGCPPVLVWSALSDPFTIAPWYDSAGLPPVKITLPGIDGLRKLKPNVAFAMPPELFDAAQKDAKKTLKGENSAGGGLGLAWICGFSIPIITICAFIVLNIFLSLFDLFFQWMLFIKICLPIPVPKKS